MACPNQEYLSVSKSSNLLDPWPSRVVCGLAFAAARDESFTERQGAKTRRLRNLASLVSFFSSSSTLILPEVAFLGSVCVVVMGNFPPLPSTMKLYLSFLLRQIEDVRLRTPLWLRYFLQSFLHRNRLPVYIWQQRSNTEVKYPSPDPLPLL